MLSRLFAALFASFALFAVAAPAIAQVGVAGRPLTTCILRDTGGMDARELIRHPERFDCKTPQYDLGPGDFWVISQDIGALPPGPIGIRFASVWQDRLTFHALFADGRFTTSTTDARGVTPLIQLGAIVQNKVPAPATGLVRTLWHVEGAANLRGTVIGARLLTGEENGRANLIMAAIYAALGGMCVALICYNLALWGALRYRFQLWYCAMVSGVLTYAFSSSGALAWVFPHIANNDRLRLNYLILGLLAASAMMFARSFFEDRVYRGWLGRVTEGAAILMAAAGAFVFFAAETAIRTADVLFTSTFIAFASVVIPTLWRAWRMRSNFLWVFAIAWGVPILASVLRVLANLHILPWSFWVDNSTVLSLGAEALLSSLAIAYRIRLLRDQRDEAIASEVMARRLADTDPLTGLLNRRAFLAQAIGRKGEQQLLLADLDHFKRVNETLGHDGGDEVLRLFARMLRANVPADALVARMGGEEFAIVTDTATAIEPETLLAKLRATRMPFDLTVTASIGACQGSLASEVDWKRLYRNADIALFDAKAAGRDRARHARREAA
jgi:diguanylate cyclase (GGDEF)-like protein